MRDTDYMTVWQTIYRETYAAGRAHWRPELATPREFIDFIQSDLAPKPPSRVLEAGCGDGLNCIFMAEQGYDIIGMDVVPEAIGRARAVATERSSSVTFQCHDLAGPLPSELGRFDLWVDIKVLHCLWDDSARSGYLRNAMDSLRPGGVFFLNCGLALADVRDYLPDFFDDLDDSLKAQADSLDRFLEEGKRTGIRCETLDFYCQECESAGFKVLRAGRCAGKMSGWGAVVIARKPHDGCVPLQSIRPLVVEVPPAIQQLTGTPQSQIVYERYDCLNVHAHESSVWHMAFEATASSKNTTAEFLAKRYKENIPPESIQSHARLLDYLNGAGHPVPRVFAVVPEARVLAMRYCGDITLDDALAKDWDVDWPNILRELARLHNTLSNSWPSREMVPEWRFSREQRLKWAEAGLSVWLDWLRLTQPESAAIRDAVQEKVCRLTERDPGRQVIWGDCNPKNIVMGSRGVHFLDFQPKRSSIMLDIVLLFSFANRSYNYIARESVLEVLPVYVAAAPEKLLHGANCDSFFAWYDEELVWRILVYGSSLLYGREQRLHCWESICRKMAKDLCAICNTKYLP